MLGGLARWREIARIGASLGSSYRRTSHSSCDGGPGAKPFRGAAADVNVPEQLDSEGTAPSASIKEAFRSYRRRSRTELAEDVDWALIEFEWMGPYRDGQRIMMMEIEKETKTIGVALEPAQDGQGLVISGLDANG